MRFGVILLALLASAEAFAQSANVSDNPPAYTNGAKSLSQTPSGGLRTQPQDGAGHDVSTAHPFPVSGVTSATITNNPLNVRGVDNAGTNAGKFLTIQGASNAEPVIIRSTGTTNVQGVANGVAVDIIGTDALGANTGKALTVQGAPGGSSFIVSSVATQPINGTVTVGNDVNVRVTGANPLVVEGLTAGVALNVLGTDAAGANAGKFVTIQGAGNMASLIITPVSASMYPADIQRAGGQPITGSTDGTLGVTLSPGSTTVNPCSGKITSASAQVLLANNATRQGFQIMNLVSNSNNMGINFESASPSIGVSGTYTLQPGMSYTTPPNFHPRNNIYIIGTQNDSFSCDAW